MFGLGELDDAEQRLRESIAIYEGELPEHGYAVQPRMHLARVLTERTRRRTLSAWTEQCEAALGVLAPALRVQRNLGPVTIEMSCLLVAQANATRDDEQAIALLAEALTIDRELYGDSDPEVCIDVVQRASRLLMINKVDDALHDLQVVMPHVESWELERPALAANVLSLHLVALDHRGSSAFSNLETAAVRQHLERLLPRVPRDSLEYKQATMVLSH